jgi:hypothetical protein
MDDLEKFIVKAKANSWVGGSKSSAQKPKSSRLGSFDSTFEEGSYFYQDSFFGETQFCGQEHVCLRRQPVWSQAYYGYLVRPDIFDGSQTREILKIALRALYREYRFLGGFSFQHERYQYVDVSHGDYRNFHGQEQIIYDSTVVYELRYFGGIVRK